MTSFTASNTGDCTGSQVFGFGVVDFPNVADWIAGITGGQVTQTCDTCFQSVVAQGARAPVWSTLASTTRTAATC